MITHDDFKWYAGADEEYYTAGPYDTRDEAIREALDSLIGEFQDESGDWKVGFYLVQATKPSLRLSDWIKDADELMEYADERLGESDRVGADGDDGPWFECTPEQEKDLEARIKKACDEWQSFHGLTFTCQTFAQMRGPEFLVLPHPSDEEHSQ